MLLIAYANERTVDNFDSVYVEIVIFSVLNIVCIVELLTSFGVLPLDFIVHERMVIVIEVFL